MVSSGRSTCCSMLTSATPSTVFMAAWICLPVRNMVFRSSPNSFTAIWACVPESMASMRCDIGCPISMFAPGMVDSFSLTSLATAPRVRPLSSIYGASISETLEPSACSSSSARPVLRATVLTSGTSRMSSSARRPMRSLSSRDMPGNALTLIVNDPR